MKTCFIINPRSGRSQKGLAYRTEIVRFVAQHALDAEILLTDAPGHATRLARQAVANGFTHVFCVGGDGTLNEVAQALVHTPVVLVLMPNGSGNGLARHLGLPMSLPRALALLLPGTAKTTFIDSGTANGYFFCNVMGLGFDADIAARFNSLTKRGLPGYLRVLASAYRECRALPCTIHAGGERWSQDVLLLAVANSDQYGNNVRIAPRALVDDGQLDLVAVSPRPPWALLGLAIGVGVFGFAGPSRGYRRVRGVSFRIERKRPGLIHTDGEVHETSAMIEIRINPQSLRLLVPADSRGPDAMLIHQSHDADITALSSS